MGVTFWVDYEQLEQGIAVIKWQHLHWLPWTVLLKPDTKLGLAVFVFHHRFDLLCPESHISTGLSW